MKAIFCYGTREPESALVSSLTEARAEKLCGEYDVVVNEIHHIDLEDRELSCIWDVFVTKADQLRTIEAILNSVLASSLKETCYRKRPGDLPFKTRHAVLGFGWLGEDIPYERPPVRVVAMMTAIENAMKANGYKVTVDRIPSL